MKELKDQTMEIFRYWLRTAIPFPLESRQEIINENYKSDSKSEH